jgi:hypothetical protein
MGEQAQGSPADSPVDRLRRWELFGAHWQVISRTSTHVELALLTCSGGEVADRMSSDDPTLMAYVGSRTNDQTG